ncbi:MAG: hypothetical protein BRC41_13705 [Cyanobacteria bacterium QH_9_48_43]|nr:MAG: hypothetical protein BRC45_12330 [Cyanobacteria bacterium QS_5_48_63]PSO82506.1 MAG: hypothetical protein BRC41_13705 [Cyanobacteria bacterium QH_9_48_43]PSO91539.1 MAG: hypothetical protein BRC43_00980 [Cyanobacteria bacterium QS_3_48_167]PSP04918.1 MAG: hypothetical protein BRC51_06305 [Cyanobacteria bacterium SW_12_48_29]
MDESGIDSNESSPYGWCEKGQRFQAQRLGKGRETLSLMGALCQEKFLAPMVYQGYCTAQLIETWLQDCLLPLVKPGQIIVMDNAPFHNSKRIRKLIEDAGCEFWYLPKYSRLFQPHRGGKKLKLQLEKSYLNITFMFIKPPMLLFKNCKYFAARCYNF